MLDDLFEKSRVAKRYGYTTRAHHFDRYHDKGYGHYNPLLNLVLNLLENKAILGCIILMILVCGALGIWLIVTLLPHFGQLIVSGGKVLEQPGIKGILETVVPLLQRVWEGTGK